MKTICKGGWRTIWDLEIWRFGDLGVAGPRTPNPESRTPNPESPIPNPSPRRGVLLLVVMAVLALFALIAVAFVVLTGQAQRGARSMQNLELTRDPPENLLRQAAMQVFRGPTTNYSTGLLDQSSVMQGHSLLEDIYGNEYIFGECGVTYEVAGFPQLLNIPINFISFYNTDGTSTTYTAAANLDNLITALTRRIGCVLTITEPTSVGFGQSTRIVGINVSVNPPELQVVAFPDRAFPPAGTEFTINGVPFSGTGFGYNSKANNLDLRYDSSTGQLTANPASSTVWPVALLPNLPLSIYADPIANPAPSFTFGGANEDYCAADFQNMLLAAQAPDPAAPAPTIQTLPSLHRSALVRYWFEVLKNHEALWGSVQEDDRWQAFLFPDLVPSMSQANKELIKSLKRNIILRPSPENHYTDSNGNGHYDIGEPCFTGGNTRWNPGWTGGWVDISPNDGVCDFAWDVDNDGDGVADSVWVDLGLPARQTTDGRWYRPLFAILCVDLDGRLNLNAHGSLPQADAAYLTGVVDPTPAVLPVGTATETLPRGLGFGPAEINLYPLLNPTLSDWTIYNRVLTGGVGGFEGRYGSTPVPGAAGLDTLGANKWFEYAGEQNSGINYWWGFLTSDTYIRDSFGSPPDVFGRGVVGLDLAGRPIYMNGMGATIADNPYELNLDANQHRGLPAGTTAADNPFSPAELERLLRPFDRDAPSLPGRLWTLTLNNDPQPVSVLVSNLLALKSFTTESWDLPVPAVTSNWRIVERLKDRLTDGGLTDAQALALLPQLLPAEALAGLKMDVNRPLGNGRAYSVVVGDDTANPGVVDAPAAPSPPKQVALSSQTAAVSYDGAGALASNPLEARQLMARQLYVMMLTLADRKKLRDQFGSGDEAARAVAQWAVNVVDFRDRDNIMTPFNYDRNYAYDDSTGHPLTDAAGTSAWNPRKRASEIVWGCERPELLITETTAFHDRKTEDLSADGGTRGGSPSDVHEDYDQRLKPEGSLFVELYNPAGPFDPPAGDTNESYQAGGRRVGSVRLDQTTPTDAHPVWRLLITETNASNDPDHPTATRPAPERSVYFVNPTAANPSHDGEVRYFTTAQIAPILPGRYALIGPSATTYVGTRTGGLQDGQTRRIVLAPEDTPDESMNQVSVHRNRDTTSSTNELPTDDIKPPVAVVIDQPQNRRMSVSEPTGGYPDYKEGDTEYDPIRPQPLDNGNEILMRTGTEPNYRIVHLQRLANPRKPYKDVNTLGQLPTPPEDYNPYVTIDSQPIDLTAFNGMTATDDDLVFTDVDVMFASHQRGEENQTATDGVNNLWRQRLDPKTRAETPKSTEPTDTHVFKYILQHTLGYLNTPFGDPMPGSTDPTDAAEGWRSYRGDPQTGPFPWLTWNNRPFVNQLELMLVPRVRSSQLLRNFNIAQSGNPYVGDNPDLTVRIPFPHLMNMFLSGSGATGEELHRLFEYLRVPSPFVGTETWANPTAAASAGHNFHPPFNGISTYREPGRINLNTVYSKAVYDGLMNGIGDPSWAEFVHSRRGYGNATNANIFLMDSDFKYPTEFGKPFRSFDGSNMVPTLTGNPLRYDKEIDATLLREKGTSDAPLFQYTSGGAVNNTNRNPYFRYQGIQRLGNLVTTRSNVYAVWITVGYFEVEPATRPTGWSDAQFQAVYPGGYALGRELGTDTGEIERHRAFYIFDRSIPVGFQRGQDLNVEKAVLVERFIE